MKFKDEGTQIWWDNLPKNKRDAVTKAYKCYDEMRNTPLVNDLPDTVVTTIRNEFSIYTLLRSAKNWHDKSLAMNRALQLIGNGWLEFDEVEVYPTPCQHLRGWLEYRELDELIERCELAVEREYERMQKEA